MRKIDLVNGYSSALIEKLDSSAYPALLKHYERKYKVKGKTAVLTHLLVERIQDDEFTLKALRKKYPNLTDQEIAAEILKTSN